MIPVNANFSSNVFFVARSVLYMGHVLTQCFAFELNGLRLLCSPKLVVAPAPLTVVSATPCVTSSPRSQPASPPLYPTPLS